MCLSAVPCCVCNALLGSGTQSFCAQHKACFEGHQSLMVQFKKRDVELMLVPVWVKDGVWQLAVETHAKPAARSLLGGSCVSVWVLFTLQQCHACSCA